MSISKNPYKRFRIIDGLLRRRHYPSKRDIMEKLEEEGYPVSSRTFENDIECLRSKMNLPVEYDRYHNGYCYSREGAGLDISFTDDELELIWLAVSSLRPFHKSSAIRSLRTSIEELMQRMDIDVTNSTSLPSKVMFDRGISSAQQCQILAVLLDAVYQRLSIEVTLCKDTKRDKEQVRIPLDHLQLREENGSWVVNGLNNNKPAKIALCNIYKVEISADNSFRLSA